MKHPGTKRVLEIIPGFTSWFVIGVILTVFCLKPLWVAVFLIVYLVYWVCRLFYMSSLMALAHYRVLSKKDVDWTELCRGKESDLRLEDVWHVVLYTVYKEPDALIEESLTALKNSDYRLDRIILVMAGEEREAGAGKRLEKICEKFKDVFADRFVFIHPAGLPGEMACKGANATYAARRVETELKHKHIPLENVLISCFDADTCPDRKYLGCLTYNFMHHAKRFQVSFQPLPVYNNNFYRVPAFARVIEMGSTFWQLVEGMRPEKFITFSSHSMSFKTLAEVDYWPVDMISDDSLIFWKCFQHYHGDYRTYPLEVPVYMDIAVGDGFLDTIAVQYKQKRRWAWGVETFAYAGCNFMQNPKIPWFVKGSKLLQLLDNHVNWATWSIIISFITPAVLLWARTVNRDSLVFLNLSYLNTIIGNALILILLLCAFISMEFIPPRPKHVSRMIYVVLVLQWLLVPLVSALLGSLPALDAQTRFMFGGRFSFFATPKKRAAKSPA